MNQDKTKQLENLQQERLSKLRYFEELNDDTRAKEKHALNDLDNLQQTAYHYLTTYHDNETDIYATLGQIDRIKDDLQAKFKRAYQQINQEQEDYEYHHQMKRRKLTED